MNKRKLPIIIAAVIAAAGAGLFFSGIVGGKSGPTKKHVVEPVVLAQDFTVNLTDTDALAYVAANVAVQLEPMDEVHWAAFSGAGGGGHGGGGEAPGPPKVAAYPKFHHAVIKVLSSMSSDTLRTEKGKEKAVKMMLDEFHHIAEVDAAEAKAGAGADDPTHVGPPYHVYDAFFTKLVVDVNN